MPNFVGDFDPGPRRIWPEFGDMCPGSVACPCLHTEASAGSGPRQFSSPASGDSPLSDGSGIRCLFTLKLLDPPVASGETVGVRLFELDDIISCATQLPRLSALLPENSALCVLLERDVSDLMCLVLTGTDGGVCVFSLRKS